MKKIGFVLAALAAALLVTGGTAEARAKRAKVVVTPAPWYAPWWGYWATMPWTVRDPRLAASNFAVGAGATGAYWALRHNHHNVYGSSIRSGGGAYVAASAACAAVSPIVGTIVTGRELTQREVFVSTANCFVPVVGGWAMNYWFDYYGWDRPKKKRR
jgi:hypothetical protein